MYKRFIVLITMTLALSLGGATPAVFAGKPSSPQATTTKNEKVLQPKNTTQKEKSSLQKPKNSILSHNNLTAYESNSPDTDFMNLLM